MLSPIQHFVHFASHTYIHEWMDGWVASWMDVLHKNNFWAIHEGRSDQTDT